MLFVKNMHILVLNSGSSSIKCSLYDFSHFKGNFIKPVWNIKIQWKKGHTLDILKLEKQLRLQLKGKSINCIGHRIVHGGTKYKKSVRIDAKVKKQIRSLVNLAPLHNKADLAGIKILEKLFPGVLQIAVFDTSFHRTLPKAASVYPGPYKWFQKGIIRFGFHGISFQYCAKRAVEILRHKIDKMVICHLGSGASLSAIKNGKSIDTTMGFTPLEGLMMDTRSGTVDPGILLHLLTKKKMSPQELSLELYEKSGLLGLSGISSDMRDILERASKGHVRSKLALDVYLHRLTSLIGSMIASLGGLDLLVFTGGIGENAPIIRKRVCKSLAFLGIELGKQSGKGDRILSSASSKIKVLLIHTKEEFEIAKECWKQKKLESLIKN